MYIKYKTVYATLWLFFILFGTTKASEPSRFPINPTANWYVYVTNDIYIGANPNYHEFIHYYIYNDTTINSKLYYKIYKSGIAYYDEPFPYENIYVGALRDEGNKFFYIKKDEPNEKFLFDFNLKLGDTIKSVIGKNNIVNQVDSLPDGRKTIASAPFICAGCCPVPYLIEGIGHAGGLFENPPCNHPGYQNNQLICYYENGELVYKPKYALADCDTIVSPIDTIKQSRFPLKPTSKWRINYKEMNYDTTYTNGDEDLNFYISGDTTINKIKYFKLYKSGTGYWDPPVFFENVYLGAIRETENKIYYLEKSSSIEELLYDFDVKVNDTIKSSIENGMIVTSVDTLNDGRKKINVKKTDFPLGKCNNINNTYLIEGVGSMGGLLYESPCDHIGFREHYLLCYYEEENVIYQNTLSPLDCDGQPPLTLKLAYDKSVKIHQNQVNNRLIVEFRGNTSNESMLYIYDIAGRLKLSSKIQAHENISEIDISTLRKGIYIVKVNSNQINITEKIIVE